MTSPESRLINNRSFYFKMIVYLCLLSQLYHLVSIIYIIVLPLLLGLLDLLFLLLLQSR